MRLNPYLHFDGNCRQAFEFYAHALNADIHGLMTFRGSPMEKRTPPDWLDKVMHVRLLAGDQIIMGSDLTPEHFHQPAGFSVTINTQSAEEAEKVFAALSENAKEVQMPLQQTFWALRYGSLTDQFGIPWMINCEGRPDKAQNGLPQ